MNVYLGANEIDPKTLGSLDLEGIYKGSSEVWKSTLPYLCFTTDAAGSTIGLIKNGSPIDVTLETSTDGKTWTTYTFGTPITLTNVGDKVYWRNKSEIDTGFSTSTTDYYNFTIDGSMFGSGDINYLLNKNSTTSLTPNCFSKLFYDCLKLKTAPALPATTLANNCYYNMFSYCSGLTTAPELPATTLADYCYIAMFSYCSSLTTAPELPATTLADYCYYYMFSGCSNLTTAPELPATSLDDYCYAYMFYNCQGLTTVSALPATTLAYACYRNMFSDCDNLTTLPALPATTLVDYCYYYMFGASAKVKLSTTMTGEYINEYRIPKTGTGVDASNTMGSMFGSTGGTFIGTPAINATYYTSNTVIS